MARKISGRDPALFPIRDLVRRTGVNASTLRAWENRHGLLTPTRTDSGHRLYGDADVARVTQLVALIESGYSLAEARTTLEEAELQSQSGPDEHERRTPDWRVHQADTLRAIAAFDSERLDEIYDEACSVHPIDQLTRQLLLPVLVQIGERWKQRESGIAEEHFFTAWLRNKLGARLHHSAGRARGKPVILACLEHETHEIGLLLFALGTLHRGFRVIYLGANLPIRQIVHAARRTHAAGIVLAGREQAEPAATLADIAWLTAQSPCPVLVGSHFSVQTRNLLAGLGAHPLGDNLEHGLDVLEHRIERHSRRLRRSA